MLVDQHGRDMPVTSVPVDTNVSPEIQKAVQQYAGELFEKLDRLVANSPMPVDDKQPKGFFTDPFATLDSVGMGYRPNPSPTTYETLRQMTERNTLLGSIVQLRTHQMAAFCREQENQYSVGYLIRKRGVEHRRKRLTASERDKAQKIRHFVENMGQAPSLTRDGLEDAMKKMVRDSLTFDQVNMETVRTRGGDLYQTLVHDPATIRLADQSRVNPRGIPLTEQEEKTRSVYAQVLNGSIVKEFTARELSWGIRNPRSNVRVGRYGLPEPQMLVQIVTAHLWAEEWNRKAFSQGSTIKGVFNIKGNIDRIKYEAFRRQWMAQVGGITNAWKTPFVNSDGIEFVPMQLSNTEMGYNLWIEYLIKIACAIYLVDPSEINFDLRGGSQGNQPAFMTGNEAQQKMSKDRGLRPLLTFFANLINRNIVWQIDPTLEFAFIGLDAKSEAENIELRQKQGQTHYTINELRALDDMDPLDNGNVIMNPTYTGWVLQQQQQQGQQQGGMGGAGGMPPMGGGAPGQGGQPQQPMEQPYGGRLGPAGQQPTPGAQQGQQKLNAMAQGPKEHEDLHDEDDDIRMLRGNDRNKQNDWASSVHASLGDSDLKKSNPVADLFFEVDL
jgi:hypothetical protein